MAVPDAHAPVLHRVRGIGAGLRSGGAPGGTP
jgi:hypothetical protein